MFDIAEEFFTSIGLYAMTQDFKTNSMYEQPPGKAVVCHASAMDFRSTESNNTMDGMFRYALSFPFFSLAISNCHSNYKF